MAQHVNDLPAQTTPIRMVDRLSSIKQTRTHCSAPSGELAPIAYYVSDGRVYGHDIACHSLAVAVKVRHELSSIPGEVDPGYPLFIVQRNGNWPTADERALIHRMTTRLHATALT
jgi:hypothetical protein